MEGRGGAYLVIAVDRDREVADLIPTAGDGMMEEDVPFASIVPVQERRAKGD